MPGPPLAWLRNAVDFPLRQAIRWRRGGVRLPAEPKDDLFPAAAQPEADRLVATYHLQRWQEVSGRRDYAASLFYLQMLERALREAGAILPPTLDALDAGVGSWFYVPTLHGLLTHYGTTAPRSLRLDGVELDAWRVYGDCHSRYDWAQAFTAGLPGVTYLPGEIRTYRRPVQVACLLYPFLFAPDLRRWGLPRRYLRPAALLAHVAGQIAAGGWLLIANSGAAERAEQHRLLQAAGLAIAWWGRHDSSLFPYHPERYVTIVSIHR